MWWTSLKKIQMNVSHKDVISRSQEGILVLLLIWTQVTAASPHRARAGRQAPHSADLQQSLSIGTCRTARPRRPEHRVAWSSTVWSSEAAATREVSLVYATNTKGCFPHFASSP